MVGNPVRVAQDLLRDALGESFEMTDKERNQIVVVAVAVIIAEALNNLALILKGENEPNIPSQSE